MTSFNVTFDVFIYGVPSDSVSSSDYAVSNCRLIGD